MNYTIFTDSSANLPNHIIDKYDIRIVSLVFFVDDNTYISYEKGKENDLKPFYTMLRDKNTITTSCVNESLFYNEFKKELMLGHDILYIGFSSALSNTCASGFKAADELRKEFPERKVFAVDSLAASLGEGMIVNKACELRESGMDISTLHLWLEENKLFACHYFTVEDLYYLFKGGRVSRLSYVIGTIAMIKPVLHVDDYGRLIPLGKVIGRKRSLMALADKLKENIIDPEEQTIFISHGDCMDDVNYLIDKIKKDVKVKDIVVNYVDPVIGAHSGPGTVALFFFGKKR